MRSASPGHLFVSTLHHNAFASRIGLKSTASSHRVVSICTNGMYDTFRGFLHISRMREFCDGFSRSRLPPFQGSDRAAGEVLVLHFRGRDPRDPARPARLPPGCGDDTGRDYGQSAGRDGGAFHHRRDGDLGLQPRALLVLKSTIGAIALQACAFASAESNSAAEKQYALG
jgi:hypothetical protein